MYQSIQTMPEFEDNIRSQNWLNGFTEILPLIYISQLQPACDVYEDLYTRDPETFIVSATGIKNGKVLTNGFSRILYIDKVPKLPNVLEKYDKKNITHKFVDTNIYGKDKDGNTIILGEETKIEKYLPECIKFIEEGFDKKEKVLVHCVNGSKNSPFIIMGFMLKKAYQTMPKDMIKSGPSMLPKIMMFVKKKSPNIDIGHELVSQLESFEKNIKNIALTN